MSQRIIILFSLADIMSNFLCHYKLGSVNANISDTIKYLGVSFMNDMKWNTETLTIDTEKIKRY